MSTSIHTLHAPTALQHFVWVMVAALRNTAAAWKRSRRRRSRLRELESLDERMLRDIGVDRSELQSLVAELTGDAPATRRAAMRCLP